MKRFLSIALIVAVVGCKSDKEEKSEDDSFLIPSSEQSSTKSPEDESIARGKTIYSKVCTACHLPNGQGIPGTYPPLDDADWLTEKREESIRAVKYGISRPIEVNGEPYDNLMPSMGLNDQEVANVMNYIMNSWSNDTDKPVTEEEVAGINKGE